MVPLRRTVSLTNSGSEWRKRRKRSRSAAEVLVELFAWQGRDVVRHLRGMYAFAVWDRRSRELFCARDPFGIKPLYYLPRGRGVVFASELKALVAAAGAELRIEPGALVASMLYYWLPEQRCAIDGVRKLPGGSWARLRPDGSCQVEPYWRIAEVAAEAASVEAAAASDALLSKCTPSSPRMSCASASTSIKCEIGAPW